MVIKTIKIEICIATVGYPLALGKIFKKNEFYGQI
jgi:hypothetical protein